MKETRQTRRQFLKAAGLAAASCALGGCRYAFREAQGGSIERRPNVILIFSDDQGTIDVNCYGAKDLHTPHLDSLAAKGVRFTQFYVAAPICSPSRAALLTGRYPQRAQLDSNASGRKGLPGSQVTIAEVLKAVGYRTAVFGKWHLGTQDDMSPLAQGFDEFFGHKEGCIDNYSHFFYWQGPNRHDLWDGDERVHYDGKYFPDLVTNRALRFIEENKDRPFFLYLPFNMPHYPLQAQEEFTKEYEGVAEPRKAYAAFLSELDDKVGKVVGKIDSLGLRKNTIVVFLSDNGHSVEERANFGGGSAGLFRGHKFTLWEGGIRMPCIVSWPGRIPRNETRSQMTISTDWLPTIAGYCQAEVGRHKIDGRNISQVIASQAAASPHEVLHWQVGRQWAVRKGKWKLVCNGPPFKSKEGDIPAVEFFLSDFEQDQTETTNLADRNPEVLKELVKLHDQWSTEVCNL